MVSDVYANNPETKRRALSDCEQIFEDMPGGTCFNWPDLNRLEQAVAPSYFVKVAELDRLGLSVTEALGSLGGLRQNQVEVISVRESIDRDNATGRAMLQLATASAKMEPCSAREKTLVKLKRVGDTGDGSIHRQGTLGAAVGHLREEEGIVEMRRFWVDGGLADYTQEEPRLLVMRQEAMVDEEGVDMAVGSTQGALVSADQHEFPSVWT